MDSSLSPVPGTFDPGALDRSVFEFWAPYATAPTLRVTRGGETHVVDLARSADGWVRAEAFPARPGDRYSVRLTADGPWLPDPRSLSQPDGVDGDSEVIDPTSIAARPWRGRDLRGAVLYELHVGTFTSGEDGRGGTFDSAIERLGELADLGIDAVEVMPIASFPGERGWGYDGVGLYAVHAAYGGPDAFARFIDAAHAHGIAVVLDVVFNHLGPAGNHLPQFGPYLTPAHVTPWGAGINLDQPGSEGVRAFILGAARQWLVEMGVDGLRLDAVHALTDTGERHLLAELSDATAAWSAGLGRPLTLIAESDLNQPATVTPTSGGGLGMTMQWADDIHHAVHAWATGERQGYYCDFGSSTVLERTLTRMFEHTGTFSSFRGSDWGAPVDPDSSAYDGSSFVAFLQNHDQVGNRAAGDRIDRAVSPGVHAAAAALVLLGAATPMLFQGEEWAASSPFTFFTDHDADLGPAVTRGRTEEFALMGWSDPVPDPQARSTFESAILDWHERDEEPHARMLAWYTQLLHLRRSSAGLRDGRLRSVSVEALAEETVLMRRPGFAVLAHRGADAVGLGGVSGEVIARFDDVDDFTGALRAQPFSLLGPGALVIRTDDA